MRNLRGQPMKMPVLSEAKDCLGHLLGDCEKIGFAWWRKLGKPEQATGNLLNLPAIPQCIERARMNAGAQRLKSSQRSMALFEDAVRLFHWRSHDG